jgi:hypothetical protein
MGTIGLAKDNDSLGTAVADGGDMRTTLVAGPVAGVAGLVVFLVLHHAWIMPIWFILPLGLILAGLGGMAVGQAYRLLLPHLPRRPWTALALVALISATLLPPIILAELREPMFDVTVADPRLAMSVGSAIVVFVLELPFTAAIAGGLAGWLLVRTQRAAFSTALAGFVFALGPGHNIPFLGSTPGTGKGIVMLLAIIAVSSIMLVEIENWLWIRESKPNKLHIEKTNQTSIKEK